VAKVWSQYSTDGPPPDEMRKARNGMLKALAGAWDEFMRTPQFMEMMKVSLNGALDLRRMARDGMNKIHEGFETPTKEDLDSILLAIRHIERRVLDRLEGMDDRVRKITERLEKPDERGGKPDGVGAAGAGELDERIRQIERRIGKIDGGIGKLGERIEELINRPPVASVSSEGAPGKRKASIK